PSGDDVLVGALALLDALADRHAGACAMRANLARAVSHIPPGLTSPLSRCFLRVAAAGHVGECLHAAVSSCLTADPDAAVAAIRDIGHSSGWDMMAGIVTALDAVTARNDLVYLAQGKSTWPPTRPARSTPRPTPKRRSPAAPAGRWPGSRQP